MQHHHIQHVDQIFRCTGLRLVVGIVDLCSCWTSATRAECRKSVSVICKKQRVDKIDSREGDLAIQNTEFRRQQICPRQDIIGRVVAEDSWRIEKILPHTSAKGTQKGAATCNVARHGIEQSPVAGRIEGAQQVENELYRLA